MFRPVQDHHQRGTYEGIWTQQILSQMCVCVCVCVCVELEDNSICQKYTPRVFINIRPVAACQFKRWEELMWCELSESPRRQSFDEWGSYGWLYVIVFGLASASRRVLC